jgi:outer membrane protein OmpA-like peptidoglycan-associated protein
MITEPVKTEPKKDPEPVVVVPPPKKDTVAVVVVVPPVKDPEPVVETPKVLPSSFVVKVIDASSNTPLDAKVSLKGLRDNVIVPMTSNGVGEYSFSISATQTKDYRLSVEVDGYSFQNINVKLDGASANPKNASRTVSMRKLQVGSVSILRNIYFDFDLATFKTEAYPELNKLLTMMQQNSALSVEIGGHTDAYGTKEVNMRLSKRRAEAVKDYLVKKGIDARRITAVGYGKSRPLASNDDEEEGRELNRRVEFKVLKN